MQKFYFDVTQLVHWQGKLTGIPRVMYELATRYYRNRPETIFVSWVKEQEAFYEIDFESTVLKRGNGVVYKHPSTDISTPEVRPTLISQLFKKAARVGIVQITKVSPKTAAQLRKYVSGATMHGFDPIIFSLNDELFIPWGEWWDPNFISKLREWHKQTGLRLIQVIHDMGPIVIPQYSGAGASGGSSHTFPIYCRQVLPICDLVLCVSENSKRDAQKWLKDSGLKAPTIEVFRLGDDFHVAKPVAPHEAVFKESGLKGNDYILCVGTIEARKNHRLIYYAYKLAKYRGIDLPKMVIVGRLGWGTEQDYALMTTDPETKDSLLFLHDASDEELSWLYSHALFSVFPSFYEGWGIPIAESVARGVPCLCSNTSSMVEIAEGFVEHFSPASSDELLSGMQNLLRPEVLKKARAQAAKYRQKSWDDSYEQVTMYERRLTV